MSFVFLVLLAAAPAQLDMRELGGGDKVLHFGASLVVTDAVWALAGSLDAPVWARATSSIVAAAAVGIGKELVDVAGLGDPSAGDLVYNALGIGAGVGFALAAEAVLARDRPDEITATPSAPARGAVTPSGRASSPPR